ncbi:hypothetical protein ACF09I_32355 [Streptomyces sp. NPDC014940]|uniref:hypothetical protein n=1 Tax=Streptomyces sp. NPDC014940 TaxID=3364932 RepID=UPI0036FB16AC
MSKKKRMAIAVVLSATAGSTAGYMASYYGLDVEESARLGAVVAGAVGNLLYQAFRLPPDQADASGASDATTGPATDAVSGNTNGSTAVPDTVNEPDTAAPEVPSVRPPVAAASEDRKYPRHRKLRRAGRRLIERHLAQEQDTRGEGGGRGTA